MKKFKVAVQWMMTATIEVEAEDIEDAIDIAADADLPAGEFLEDSFEVCDEMTFELNGMTYPDDEDSDSDNDDEDD